MQISVPFFPLPDLARPVNVKQTNFIIIVCLLCLPPVVGDEPAAPDPKDKLIVETVLRLKDFDLNSSAKAKGAVLRYLKSQPGTDKYFELIERFKPVEIAEDLVAFCLQHSTETGGVRGAELLFAMEQQGMLNEVAKGDDPKKAEAAVVLIGYAGAEQTTDLLGPLVKSKLSAAIRSAAVTGLGRSVAGQRFVLKLVTDGTLPADLKFAAANALLSSEDSDIKTEAAKHLTLPATADAKPLPTIAELVRRKGDVASGARIFDKPGTCITCHKISGKGKEVGPDLSEIGSKLSREAMYVSILNPSAAISHNYESYILVTDRGRTVTGLLISKTEESVTLRTKEGLDRKVATESIEELVKQKISLMPQDLQKLLTAEQLVDLVEYLLTLRKPGSANN